MTGTQALGGRAVIGVVASVAGVIVARSGRLAAVGDRSFERWATWAFVASRLSLFSLLFLLLRLQPRGDIPAYYASEARSVIAHLLPYRDFSSSYAPLHPYLDSVPLRLWGSPLSIMLLALFAEMLILPLWLRLGSEFLPRVAVRTAALLYLTSPISLQYVTVDGQDNVIIAVLMALSMLLLFARRPIRSGAAAGLSVCLVKLIALVFAPVFFLASRRRWPWAVAMLGLVGSIYGGTLLLGLPILEPLLIEGALKTAGNLPYLFESLTGWMVPGSVWNGLTLCALGTVWAVVARASRANTERARLRVISFGMVATTLALVMFSKKSWPAYLMLVLFPLYGMFADRSLRKLWALAGFSMVVAVEHSVWATLLGEIKAGTLHGRLAVWNPLCLLLLLLEVVLVAGYGWLLLMALRHVHHAGADAQEDTIALAAASLGSKAGETIRS